mmetsp:Transcript_107308/g.218972  ORF Transcript_107308/g.218972 Transcript_107308/m.218972 type:complete len:222 (-) Transcript_107308:3-668(-)
MAADHRHLRRSRVETLGISHEGLGTADVEGGHTEELLRVVDALLLQDLGGNGHCGVHRVRDDEDACIRAGLRTACDESLDNAGIDIEEVVASHAWLAGDTSGDHNHLATLQGRLEVVAYVAKAARVCVDVREVASHAWGEGRDIVASKLCHSGVDLHEQGQGLANATCGPEDAALEATLLLGGEGLRDRAGGCTNSPGGGEHGSSVKGGLKEDYFPVWSRS